MNELTVMWQSLELMRDDNKRNRTAPEKDSSYDQDEGTEE